MLGDDLNADTIGDDLTLLLESVVVGSDEVGETELSGDEDLLLAGELELGSSQGLLGVLDMLVRASHGHEDLSNLDSGGLAESLTEGTSHTLLKSIGSSAGEHLVDTNDVPWVHSDSHVEIFSTNVCLHVLVASNTGSFESLRCNLLLLVANQMDAGGELIISCLLFTDIVNSELGVRHTSVESGFRIGLVLLVSVAAGWSSSHVYLFINNDYFAVFKS